MNVEAINMAVGSARPFDKAAVQFEAEKKLKEEPAPESQAESAKVNPEELLQQIKSLTEDGLYSVRFEMDDRSSQLVVKIVDNETDEMIRQVPAEELLELKAALDDLRGNIVNTES